MIHSQHQDRVMFAHEHFIVFCNNKTKHFKTSIKFILNKTATCSTVTKNKFNESTETEYTCIT